MGTLGNIPATMRPTLVISDRQGRLCNRLWVFSHVGAFALEHGCRVWNPAFGEYAHYFEATSKDGLCRLPAGDFPLRTPAFRRGLYGFLRLWRRATGGRSKSWLTIEQGQELCLDAPANEAVARRLANSAFTFLEGWGIRDAGSLGRHAHTVRSFFTPVAAQRANVETLLRGLRLKGGTIIGVHIRRGDYRTAMPHWFYELEVYVRLMRGLRERLHREGQKARFLISSDEIQNPSIFEDLDVTFCRGHELEDLYSLAECDCIIGPRSTYSMWAAFAGRRPLYHIMDPERIPGLENFVDNSYL